MAIRAFRALGVNQIFRPSSVKSADVPKGYLAVYVGETQKTRHLVPTSFLSQPCFRELLRRAEEEFGFDHPMGGLTLHCSEQTFADVSARLNRSRSG